MAVLKVLKNFLLCSLVMVSSITFINIATLYWVHIQYPLSSYSVICLMMASFSLKMYYLIPVSFAICIFMFFNALYIKKEKMLLPIILFLYLLVDLFNITYSFFDSWFNDEYFILGQMVQLIISVTIVISMFVYFIVLWKARR